MNPQLLERVSRREFYTQYLRNRTATYEMRCDRFKAVAFLMLEHGLSDGDTVYDLGAGHCDFDFYLRTELRWRGRYVPIDCTIDDTDLEAWVPKHKADFVVAMELVEHLRNPLEFVSVMSASALKLAALTTPNPRTVDVLACDPTHVSEISAADLREECAWCCEERSFFGQPADSLLAWNGKPRLN